MATTGEVLWSGLINRNDGLTSIARNFDSVSVSIRAAGRVIDEGEKPVSDFSFSVREIPSIPPASSVKVYLSFVRYRLGSSGVCSFLRILWPHFWIFRFGIPVLVLKGLKESDVIRFYTVPVFRLPPDLSGKHEGFENRKKLTPQHVSNLSFEHASRLGRLISPRLPSKRLAFSDAKSLPPNPLNVQSSYVDGTEQFGTPWSQTSASYTSYHRSFSSVRTPNFGLVSRKDLPVNPYSLTLEKTNLGQGLYFRQLRSSPSTVYFNKALASTTIIDGVPALPIFDEALYNSAVRKLGEKAELDINNIAQDLVQFRQTTNMIASSATRIYRSVTALKHGNIPLATSSLFHGTGRHDSRQGNPSKSKSLANNWLELQYGWKPLLQDIDGSMRALANFVQVNPCYRTVRATTKKEVVSYWPVTFPNQAVDFGHSGDPLTVLVNGERVSLQSIRTWVRFRLNSNLISLLSQTGFTSPVNLAWELLPYSFVVDWFLPIGPYLESFSAFEGMTFVDGSVTHFSRTRDFAHVSFNGVLPRSPSYDSKVRAYYDHEIVQVTRQKLSQFPVSYLPRFKNPFSSVHAANALALLKTAFKS